MGKAKEYTNDRITVMFDLSKCIHSKNCGRGLPAVFNPQERPWVNMNEASDEAIVAQVAKCPSGALWMKDHENKMSDNKIQAECLANGPLIVKGSITVTKPDGSTEEKENMTAFCRCGASKNKPYCDGGHKDAGFEG